MSAEKAELRAAVIEEVGIRVDDVLEGSSAAALRAEGAEQALSEAAGVVRQLHAHVDRDIEAEILSLEDGALAKTWITRAVVVCDQLADNARQLRIAQRGHAQGIAFVVRMLRAQRDRELRVAEELRNQGADEFRTLKDERLAEEAAEASESSEIAAPGNGSLRQSERRRKAVGRDAADTR